MLTSKLQQMLTKRRVERFCHHCLYSGRDGDGIMMCNVGEPLYSSAAVRSDKCGFSNIAFDNNARGKLIRVKPNMVEHGGVAVYPLEYFRRINDLTYDGLRNHLSHRFSSGLLWNVAHGQVPSPRLMTMLVQATGCDYRFLW